MSKESNDWRTDIGRVTTKPKEIYELSGNCPLEKSNTNTITLATKCCWEETKRKGSLGSHYRRIGNYTSEGGSQKVVRKKPNYVVSYWKQYYTRKLNKDEIFRSATGHLPWMDYLTQDGAGLFSDVECPYDAARVYRKLSELLQAIYSWFGLSGIDEAEAILKKHYILQKEAW